MTAPSSRRTSPAPTTSQRRGGDLPHTVAESTVTTLLAPSLAQALVGEAVEVLERAGVPDPEGDAVALADRLLMLTPGEAVRRFRQAVDERAERVPLGHVLGEVELDGLSFAVGSGAFAPRPHSWPLVEWAGRTDVLPHGGRLLDLCAGVGTIGLSVGRHRLDAGVVLVESDPTAVAYLHRNVHRLMPDDRPGGQVQVLARDAADATLPDDIGRVDVVVANPPFVVAGTPLLPEYELHHPPQAIYGGADGFDMIRPVMQLVDRVLADGGWVGLEHDYRAGQPEQVRALLTRAGLTDVHTFADAVGQPRLSVARRDHSAFAATRPVPTGTSSTTV